MPEPPLNPRCTTTFWAFLTGTENHHPRGLIINPILFRDQSLSLQGGAHRRIHFHSGAGTEMLSVATGRLTGTRSRLSSAWSHRAVYHEVERQSAGHSAAGIHGRGIYFMKDLLFVFSKYC